MKVSSFYFQVLPLFFLILFLLRANFAEAQYARCYNPNQKAGLCVQINECQTLFAVLHQANLQQSVKNFIRASSCAPNTGFSSSSPFVCCTSDTDYTRNRRLTPVFNDYDDGSSSFDSWDAPPRTMLFPSMQFGGNGNAGRSSWSFNGPSVGGGTRPRATGNAGRGLNGGIGGSRNNMNTASSGVSSMLPQPPSCGGVTIGNKIYGGEDAELNEFPWMVLMEYRRRNGDISTNCAGTLINQRYVITAAHCVTGRIEREIGPLISVRLGEHDTTRQIDCNGRICAAEALRLSIEESRPHELYKEKSPNQVHDIALLRLERNVRFSDSVRPICLPAVMPSETLSAGQQLTVAGWGRTLKSARSPIKQKLNVAIIEPDQCKTKFNERKISIVPTQLCAGGKYAEDSCDGDSGGPLMRFRNGAWVLEGIVSFGFKCGLKDWPGVYTSVAAYDDWIRRNVKA